MSTLAERLFLAAPVRAQEMLLDVYGLRVRRARYAGVHASHLASLLESEHWSPEQHRRYQLRQLNELLEFASATVPLYRNRLRLRGPLRSLDELGTIPLLTKSAVRAAGTDAVSSSFKRRDLVEIHTGGTTGAPLTVYCEPSALQRNYAFFERFRAWAGVPDGCRVATLAGRVFLRSDAGPPFSRANRRFNARLFSSYHISPQNIPTYLDELAAWNPEMIDSYPSSLAPIARVALERGDGRIRPRAVITSSETLSSSARSDIELAFSCRVFDHYGAAEMAAFITQCEFGSYHVNPEFGIVELLKDGVPVPDGTPGEIVATGFLNRAMPFVRYSTGDWAVREATPCPCGRAMPRIKEVGGRLDDVIVTPDGRLIGRLDPIFKVASSLFETRIVQDGVAHLRVEVASPQPVPQSDLDAIIQALRARVGAEMEIEIRHLPALERTRSGKLRSVVNEVSGRGGTAPDSNAGVSLP